MSSKIIYGFIIVYLLLQIQPSVSFAKDHKYIELLDLALSCQQKAGEDVSFGKKTALTKEIYKFTDKGKSFEVYQKIIFTQKIPKPILRETENVYTANYAEVDKARIAGFGIYIDCKDVKSCYSRKSTVTCNTSGCNHIEDNTTVNDHMNSAQMWTCDSESASNAKVSFDYLKKSIR